MFVEQLPIPDIDDTIKDAFREKAMLVEKNKSPELIDEINNMVFELYHLSFDEINYLKNYVEKKIKND